MVQKWDLKSILNPIFILFRIQILVFFLDLIRLFIT